MEQFIIAKNNYLDRNVEAYFNCYYRGYQSPGNPDFINTLKNTFNNISTADLNAAKNTATAIITKDLQLLIEKKNFKPYTIVCIPRAKSLNTYTDNQLLFIKAVSDAAKMIPTAIDGTECIQRHTNTKTTHLKPNVGRVTATGKEDCNDGASPYPGITRDTCNIDQTLINGHNIILVDDIYTKTCNVDEDCLQTLYNLGAEEVLFYSIAYTKRD